MAKIKKNKNDKFYTKNSVVIDLLKYLNLSEYNTVIEPSAGNGSFSENIEHNNLISMDIEPEGPNIIKMDWFDYQPTYNVTDKVLVIGNPPFGNQGSLAMKFIKKCDELGVDTIAFILPKSFKKESVKNRVPLKYHLINEVDLLDNSFTLLGDVYDVPCVFQVWVKFDVNRQIKKSKTKSDLFEFVNKNNNPNYAFRRVGFYAGKIYDECNDKSEKSHYFIKSNDVIKEILLNASWEHNNTTGPKSIGKSEIVNLVESFYEKE